MKKPHTGEFEKTRFGATSKNGFRIELRRIHWIDYVEGDRKGAVFCEFMGLKQGLIVHRGDVCGLEGMSAAELDQVFSNIVRGLEFLSWQVDLIPA